MTIRSILFRLQNTSGQTNLSEQMLLHPGLETFAIARKARDTAHFVIGYNGSEQSQTALDFALWMAHQTRLASRKRVVVHVVYVLEVQRSEPDPFGPLSELASLSELSSQPASGMYGSEFGTATLLHPVPTALQQVEQSLQVDETVRSLEKADQILWQARCLAEEWRGSLEAHLCFGTVATELRRVVEAEMADLLIIGCNSPQHTLVRQLRKFPCPVLGIPAELDEPAL